MDQLVVVTHPDPITVEAHEVEHESVPDGSIALGYYCGGHLIARGVVAPEALDAIQSLLSAPVSVALAATEDDRGNIDARVCLVLPVDPSQLRDDEDGESDEPWKSSVPAPPELDDEYASGDDSESDQPHLALLPIGNVVRAAQDRNHPTEMASDVKEMLSNLLAGHAQDAVSKAIDDLLDSID